MRFPGFGWPYQVRKRDLDRKAKSLAHSKVFGMVRNFRNSTNTYWNKGLFDENSTFAPRGGRGSAFFDVCEGSWGRFAIDWPYMGGDGAPARRCQKTYKNQWFLVGWIPTPLHTTPHFWTHDFGKGSWEVEVEVDWGGRGGGWWTWWVKVSGRGVGFDTADWPSSCQNW